MAMKTAKELMDMVQKKQEEDALNKETRVIQFMDELSETLVSRAMAGVQKYEGHFPGDCSVDPNLFKKKMESLDTDESGNSTGCHFEVTLMANLQFVVTWKCNKQ